MPKSARLAGARRARRQKPLEEDLLATGPLRTASGKRKRQDEQEDSDDQFYVDAKSSSKVLRLGRELLDEESAAADAASHPSANNSALDFRSRTADDEEEDQEGKILDDGEVWGDEDEVLEEDDHIEPEDLQTFHKFLPEAKISLLEGSWGGDDADTTDQDEKNGVSLADLILEKIAQHEARQDGDREPQPADDEDVEISPKVIEVYSKIGEILSRYKSGPLPKPFKILPTIPNWEYILPYTEPDQWTTNTCLVATRIFVSAKPAVAQRFLEAVLLDRVRDDIRETKKLNVHLWNSLKKALYRPSAFFKGFLFPLVSSSCTLREAHIIGGILTRVSIPVLHSAAALKGLCDIAAEQASQRTEGSGATNVLIRVLLEKKYALPFQVVDALVFHFLRFRSVDPASIRDAQEASAVNGESLQTHTLPVLWHKCLLSFAQRYRDQITEEQREQLLDLLLTHGHAGIGPEVRRELLAGRGRGVPVEPATEAFDGDDTMVVD